MGHLNLSQRISLKRTSVLLLDGNEQALDVMRRTLTGFGVGAIHACTNVAAARAVFEADMLELVIADPLVADEDGFEFLRWMRRHPSSPNTCVAIFAAIGHRTQQNVIAARDAGANFIVGKPLAPETLLERIEWVAREARPFVVAPGYAGPDRRFKNSGPPQGTHGRRADDLSIDVPDAKDPNMSQFEVDELLKPRKVSL
jgi:DNA-binding response OmpR family regulator